MDLSVCKAMSHIVLYGKYIFNYKELYLNYKLYLSCL